MSDRPERDALSEILSRLRLTAEIYARPDYCGSWAVDTSGHRKAAFHLIERGNGWLHTDEGDSPRPLVAGDFVLFPHDAPHRISDSPEVPSASAINKPPPEVLTGPVTSLLCGFFEFQSKIAWPLLDGLPEIVVLDLRDSSRQQGTNAVLQLIIGELERDEPGCNAAVNELAYVLFIHVLRSQMGHGLSQGLLQALSDPNIGQALNCIHSDFGGNWSVDRLASEVAMSRSAFARRFNELVGMTPIRYLTEWRMQEARDLLENTKTSIAEIAERSGYQSEVAFRKAFKKVVGRTPGSVRRDG